MKKTILALSAITISLSLAFLSGCTESKTADSKALVIEKQGWFSAGGKIAYAEGEMTDVYKSAGQSIHYDHAVTFYQKPVNAKKTAFVYLHGNTQTGRCWSTTPDGREGWSEYFLRRGYASYLIDQPRRGNAARNAVDVTVPAMPVEQMYFDQFRLGRWPDFYEGVSFPQDDESVNQFWRQMTADVGAQDMSAITDGVAAVLEKSGDAVLFTHSAGGVYGWFSTMKSDKVKAIVAVEPGAFPFPQGRSAGSDSKRLPYPAGNFCKTHGNSKRRIRQTHEISHNRLLRRLHLRRTFRPPQH